MNYSQGTRESSLTESKDVSISNPFTNCLLLLVHISWFFCISKVNQCQGLARIGVTTSDKTQFGPLKLYNSLCLGLDDPAPGETDQKVSWRTQGQQFFASHKYSPTQIAFSNVRFFLSTKADAQGSFLRLLSFNASFFWKLEPLSPESSNFIVCQHRLTETTFSSN